MICSNDKNITTYIELLESLLNSRVSLNVLCNFQFIYTATNKTLLLITIATSTVSVVVVIVIIVICLVVSGIVYLKKKHQLHEVGGERVRHYLLF